MSKKLTKDSILDAALEVFIQKGFAGGAISEIAEKANINQSLIYHYFKSKQDLWTHVKKHSIEMVINQSPPIRQNTLEDFIFDLVEMRFSVYADANMRRLAHWQALEANVSQFYDSEESKNIHHGFNIPDYIKLLQDNGLVRTDVHYTSLAGIVFSLVSYAFFDFAHAYKLSDHQITLYKKLVIETLTYVLNKDENQHEFK